MPEWWKPSNAKDIKPVPWLAPNVIAHLTEIVTPEFDVLEHGCGGSTLWFAERVKSVIAVDSDSDWQRITVKLLGINGKVVSTLDDVDVSKQFDLILIDGMPLEERGRWLHKAVEIIKPSGWVVLDNANRPEYAEARAWMQKQAASFETFDGNQGGTKYLMTEFYKMKASEDANWTEPKPQRTIRRTGKRGTGSPVAPA
jgi:hypothetical protein